MFIKKTNIAPFLKYLSWKYDGHVYAPAGHRFEQFSDKTKLDLDRKTNFSAKKLFLPSSEVLFEFNDRKNPKMTAKTESPTIVLFGARPCDLNGIKYMDMVFKDDPYYMAKRRHVLLIGIQCSRPTQFDNCYCHYTNTFFADNFDLLLIKHGDGFIVKTGSVRGEGLLATKFFSSRKGLKDPGKILEKMENDFVKKTHGMVGAMSDINESVIRQFSEDCYSCTACTSACPTCHSFLTEDELDVNRKSGKRIRKWDSCQLQRYTRISGNVIFRPERLQRVKHRIFCKFRYSLENQGMMACTGCGRCIDVCNKGIDIFKVFNEHSGRRPEKPNRRKEK
jgi:ferredoxin